METNNLSTEALLQQGLQMIELEERLEMVQLTAATPGSSCCLDSITSDSATAGGA